VRENYFIETTHFLYLFFQVKAVGNVKGKNVISDAERIKRSATQPQKGRSVCKNIISWFHLFKAMLAFKLNFKNFLEF